MENLETLISHHKALAMLAAQSHPKDFQFLTIEMEALEYQIDILRGYGND